MARAGELLREARRLSGRRQVDVARAAEVRQPLVSRIERGHERPSLETLTRLVEGCGYTIFLALEELPDADDLALLDLALSLSPEERVDQLVASVRFAEDLREAMNNAAG